MFHHYPSASPYFVDPNASPYSSPNSSPYSTSNPYQAARVAAQRQRELEQHRAAQALYEQRRLAAEAERRRHQREAYEQQLREEEWNRRVRGHPSTGWSSARRTRDVDSDEELDYGYGYGHGRGYDSDEEELAQQKRQTAQHHYAQQQALRNGLHGDPRARSRMTADDGTSRRQQQQPQPIITTESSTSTSTSTSERVKIPIRDAHSELEEAAATTLQRHYRGHLHRRKALASLAAIADSLTSRQLTLALPDTLHIGDNGKLAYDSNNAPFHAFEDFLVRLLSQIDEIATRGDDKVKKTRKELVKTIEKELGRLDEMREAALSKASPELRKQEDEQATRSERECEGKSEDQVERAEEKEEGQEEQTSEETQVTVDEEEP